MSDRVATTERVVSAEREVAAPPDVVFDLLRDPRMHPVLDGSGMVRGRIRGPQRLDLGDSFGMRMRILGKVPYVISNKVVEFEQDRLIAWRHLFRHRWRYELEPVGDGERTLVRESFDYAPSVYPWLLERLDVPRAHQRNIERTLDNLARVAAERTAERDGDVAG